MAQLDIKNCDVYLKDGYTGPTGAASAKINNVLVDPVSGPTIAATGGGASGGLLAAGDYLISYTFVTALGETLRSPDSSTVTVASGNIPRVTLPALPTGATSIKLYISTASGNRASETLYASGIAALTYDMTIAAPGITAPPSVSSAGLTYAVGATTISVDGITGALVTGDSFTIAGRYQRYTIVSHTETLSNTTSVTFTPGLVTAANDNAAIVIQPHFLKIRIGEGNITWTEKRAITYTKDRGKLDTVRKGDEDPVEVKLDATWVFLKSSSGQTPTIEDVLKNRGEAANWITSSSDPCEPFAVDIVVEYRPPCSTEELEIYTIEDFRQEELGHDLKQGQLAISGKSNRVEVDVQRVMAA